jgi:hypothetical protein
MDTMNANLLEMAAAYATGVTQQGVTNADAENVANVMQDTGAVTIDNTTAIEDQTAAIGQNADVVAANTTALGDSSQSTLLGAARLADAVTTFGVDQQSINQTLAAQNATTLAAIQAFEQANASNPVAGAAQASPLTTTFGVDQDSINQTLAAQNAANVAAIEAFESSQAALQGAGAGRQDTSWVDPNTLGSSPLPSFNLPTSIAGNVQPYLATNSTATPAAPSPTIVQVTVPVTMPPGLVQMTQAQLDDVTDLILTNAKKGMLLGGARIS